MAWLTGVTNNVFLLAIVATPINNATAHAHQTVWANDWHRAHRVCALQSSSIILDLKITSHVNLCQNPTLDIVSRVTDEDKYTTTYTEVL